MNRVEFLSALDDRLKCIPDDERREALEFYYSYFEDGSESGKSERQLIEELGSPADVASKIIAETNQKLDIRQANDAGREDTGTRTGPEQNSNATHYSSGGASSPAGNVLKIILIVIGAIIVLPPAGGLLIGLAAALFGILAAVVVTLVVVPFALVCAGVAVLATAASVGVTAGGWSLMLFGLALLTVAVALLAGYGIIRLIRWFGSKSSGWWKEFKKRRAA